MKVPLWSRREGVYLWIYARHDGVWQIARIGGHVHAG
jgi:hypothetical protein